MLQPAFVDSYNVSVAAALIMYQARAQRLATLGRHGDLSEHQQDVLLASMLLRSRVGIVREPDASGDRLLQQLCAQLQVRLHAPVSHQAPQAG